MKEDDKSTQILGFYDETLETPSIKRVGGDNDVE